MPLLVYAAVFAALFGAGGAIVWKYNSAVEGAERAKNEARTWQAAHEAETVARQRTEGDLKLAQQLALDRKKETDAANDRLSKYLAGMGALAKSNPVAGAYLATPVDRDVRRVRRLLAGCDPDPAVQCPPIRPPPDAGAANERRDERRPAEGERGREGGAAGGEQ